MLTLTQHSLIVSYLKHHITSIMHDILNHLQPEAEPQQQALPPASQALPVTDFHAVNASLSFQAINQAEKKLAIYSALQSAIRHRFQELIESLSSQPLNVIMSRLIDVPYLCASEQSHLIPDTFLNEMLQLAARSLKSVHLLLSSQHLKDEHMIDAAALIELMPFELKQFVQALSTYYSVNQQAARIDSETVSLALDCYQYCLAVWYLEPDKLNCLEHILELMLKTKKNLLKKQLETSKQIQLPDTQLSTLNNLLENSIKTLSDLQLNLQLEHYPYIADYIIPARFFISDMAIQKIHSKLARVALMTLKNKIMAEDPDNQPAMWFFMRIVCAKVLHYSQLAAQAPMLQTLLLKFLISRLKILEEHSYIDSYCDFLILSSPLQQHAVEALNIPSQAAYILAGKNLFYINKISKVCMPVFLTESELTQLCSLIEIAHLAINQYKTLSSAELANIKSFTGHIHEGNIMVAVRQLAAPLIDYCNKNLLPPLFALPGLDLVALRKQLDYFLHRYERVAQAIFKQSYHSAEEAECQYQRLRNLYKRNLRPKNAYKDILRYHRININLIPLDILTENHSLNKGDAEAKPHLEQVLQRLFKFKPIYHFIMGYLHQSGLSDFYEAAIWNYYLRDKQATLKTIMPSFINIFQTDDNRLILIMEFFLRHLIKLPEQEIFMLNKSVTAVSEWLPHENTMRLKRFFHLFPDNDYIVTPTGERVLFSRWFFECVINGMEMFVAMQR